MQRSVRWIIPLLLIVPMFASATAFHADTAVIGFTSRREDDSDDSDDSEEECKVNGVAGPCLCVKGQKLIDGQCEWCEVGAAQDDLDQVYTKQHTTSRLLPYWPGHLIWAMLCSSLSVTSVMLASTG
jgi:hypothetical protein